MSLPETLNWCDTHQAGHIGTCDYPNVAVRVASRDDLLIRREVVESWLHMANNGETFDLEYHLEQALAAAEGEEE